MSISLVQKGPAASGTGGALTCTLNSATGNGRSLVATLVTGSQGTAFSAPPGWGRVAFASDGKFTRTEVWVYSGAPSGLTSFAFSSGTGQVGGSVSEFACSPGSVLSVDVTGSEKLIPVIWGSTCKSSIYGHGTNVFQNAQQWDAYVNRFGAQGAMKVYFRSGSILFPTDLNNSGGNGDWTGPPRMPLSSMIYLCYDFSTLNSSSDRAALTTSVQSIQATWPNVKVILAQEPNAKSKFSSAASYASFVAYYAQGVPQAVAGGVAGQGGRVPIAYDPSVWGTNSSAHYVDYYPGDGVTDEILADWYGSGWTSTTTVLQDLAKLADNHASGPIPIGIGEWGGSASATNPTQAVWDGYTSYATNFFYSRASSGKPTPTLMWFNDVSTAQQPENYIPDASNYKIPDIVTMYDKLTGRRFTVSHTTSSPGGDLVIAVFGANLTATGGALWTEPAGYTLLGELDPSVVSLSIDSSYKILSGASTESATVTFDQATADPFTPNTSGTVPGFAHGLQGIAGLLVSFRESGSGSIFISDNDARSGADAGHTSARLSAPDIMGGADREVGISSAGGATPSDSDNGSTFGGVDETARLTARPAAGDSAGAAEAASVFVGVIVQVSDFDTFTCPGQPGRPSDFELAHSQETALAQSNAITGADSGRLADGGGGSLGGQLVADSDVGRGVPDAVLTQPSPTSADTARATETGVPAPGGAVPKAGSDAGAALDQELNVFRPYFGTNDGAGFGAGAWSAIYTASFTAGQAYGFKGYAPSSAGMPTAWNTAIAPDARATFVVNDWKPSIATVLGGGFDAQITAWAQSCEAHYLARTTTACNIFVTLWNGGESTQTSAHILALHAYVYPRFKAYAPHVPYGQGVSADTVATVAGAQTWLSCPSTAPGDSLLDFYAVNGYTATTNTDGSATGYRDASTVFGPAFSSIRAVAPGAMLAIGEANCETYASRASWLAQLQALVQGPGAPWPCLFVMPFFAGLDTGNVICWDSADTPAPGTTAQVGAMAGAGAVTMASSSDTYPAIYPAAY